MCSATAIAYAKAMSYQFSSCMLMNKHYDHVRRDEARGCLIGPWPPSISKIPLTLGLFWNFTQ